jgi:hypothetical protein
VTRTRSSTVSRLALAVLIAAVAGAAAGATIRKQESGSVETPAGPHPIAVGDLRLRVPSGWAAAPRIFKVPGLDGPRSLSLQTTAGYAVVAQAAPGDSTLLPADLINTLGPPGKATVVPAGNGSRVGVIHYTYLSAPSIGAALDVYVVPTTRDAAILACIGGGSDCQTTLAGLQLARGRVLDPGPDAALRSRLAEVITTLANARRTLREQLAQATTPAARSAAATNLGEAYRSTLETVRPLAVGSTTGQEMERPLRRLWRNHQALARAAGAQDSRGFAALASLIATDERTLDQLLTRWDQPQG